VEIDMNRFSAKGWLHCMLLLEEDTSSSDNFTDIAEWY